MIWLAWGILFLGMAWKVASWSVGYLVVTPGRIFVVVGLVTRKLSSMPLSAITDLRLRRSLQGRVVGYGALVVESESSDQPLTVLDQIPFSEEVYLVTWLGPDLRDPIEDLVSRICKVVAPVSPFKIVRLLEQASGSQVTDSPAVARELLYRTVADRLDEDVSLERRPEFHNCLADYGNYLRRRDNTEYFRVTARYLAVVTVTAAVGLGLLLGIEYSGPVRLISRDAVLILLAVAGALSVMLISLRPREFRGRGTQPGEHIFVHGRTITEHRRRDQVPQVNLGLPGHLYGAALRQVKQRVKRWPWGDRPRIRSHPEPGGNPVEQLAWLHSLPLREYPQ